MGFLGCSCYRPLGWINWAPVLGLCQKPERFTGPAYKSSFNPASWAWEVGLRAYFLNSIRNQVVFRKIKPNPFLIIEKATLTFQNLNEFMSGSCFSNEGCNIPRRIEK